MACHPVALAAALTLSVTTRAFAAKIAVFDAASFVDTSGGVTAESDTLQASLAALGHQVVPFTATKAAGIAAALVGAAAVAIPELENGDLGVALGPAARLTLAAFVSQGGGLIVMGTTDERAPGLLNAIFGLTLSSGVVGASTITSAAAGTGYEGGPTPLANNLRTRGLDVTTLPDDALAIYVSGTRATVARLQYGGGRVVYLGWDWYAAAPIGSRDGGWLSVLRTTATDVTECSPAAGGADSDADGVPDVCDSDDGCLDVDGRRTLGDGSRIVLKRELGVETPNTLVLAADVFLPSGRVFADLDPRALPLSLVVRASDGSIRMAETWPLTPYIGGDSAGWSYEQRRKEWVYADRTGDVTNGFVSVVLKDMSESVPGRVRVEMLGRDGVYPIDDGDAPLGVLVTLGDPAAGECAGIAYAAEECRASVGADRLKCKR